MKNSIWFILSKEFKFQLKTLVSHGNQSFLNLIKVILQVAFACLPDGQYRPCLFCFSFYPLLFSLAVLVTVTESYQIN